jgi:hypothetical protein
MIGNPGNLVKFYLKNKKRDSCPVLYRLFLFVLFAINVYHFAALVVATVGANVMRQAHVTAVRAGDQLASFERIVCPAAVPTAFGNLAFWQRGHDYLLE